MRRRNIVVRFTNMLWHLLVDSIGNIEKWLFFLSHLTPSFGVRVLSLCRFKCDVDKMMNKFIQEWRHS